ncbi:YihY family inner membrane protein [Francisella frigiditurris]|uniref:YihY family inner membrane domain protein n=1 Tax=Francisella frigiditurris TaxID=1542390 RepID=A0A1J0KV67_9GAMM|nr:YihY family inner membrane protein [Francisella frigiditurris]APC97587.1 YihY family inner membrane domain protein [Francisella frigiditurris]
MPNTALLKKYILIFKNYWTWVFKEYFRKECPTAVSALTLTSLFAFVPTFLIIINILNTFEVFTPLSQKIQQFIFDNMLPSTASTVQDYIVSLSRKVSSLPILSVIFLLAIIFFMIKNLEIILNKIFYVKRARSILQSFLVYWALMTIGPIFFGFVFISSTYLLSMSWIVTDMGVEQYIINFTSFLFLVAAFFVVYRILPNTKVSSRSAFIASLFVAVVFTIAKRLFSLYIFYVPTYSVIYGSLSLIPIFILWVFITWHITLVGAVMMKGLELLSVNVHFTKEVKRDNLTIVINLLRELYEHQRMLKGGVALSKLYSKLAIADYDKVKLVLHRLDDANIIRIDSNEICYLNCDIKNLKLLEVYNLFVDTLNFKTSNIRKINQIKVELQKNLNIKVYDCF